MCTDQLQTHSVAVRWGVVNGAVSVFVPESWIRIIPQQILQTPDRDADQINESNAHYTEYRSVQNPTHFLHSETDF